MFRTALRLSLALAFVFASIAPASAAAAFAPANDEVAGGLQFSATGFAADAQGNTIVAWDEQQTLLSPDELKARRLAADGTLGPVFELAPGEIGSEPRVAMTAAGRAFVAWEWEVNEGDNAGVRGRWVEPGGALGPILTLVEGGISMDAVDVQVVVDPTGVATVAWENEMPGTLPMRRVQPDGTLGTLVADVSGGGGITNYNIAALPNGSTVAVWRGTGTEKSVLKADLSVVAPEMISENNQAGDNEIVADALGNALVVWRQPSGAEWMVQGRRLDPTGAVAGGVLTIEPAATGFMGAQVRVAADSDGDFLVTWNRQNPEGDAILHARGVNSAGVFAGPEQPLSEGLVSATAQGAAIFDAGGGALAWDRNDNGERITLGRAIDAAAVPVTPIQGLFGDGIGTISVASAPAAGVATFLVQYATSGASGAVVTRRFLLAPSCVDSAASVVQGRPIVVPLACTGPAIESATVQQQPRHGQLGPFDAAARSFAYTPDPGYAGSDSFTYTLANDGGTSALARVTISVGKDTVKPRIQKLKLIRKGKVGKQQFKFRLVFSEPATAKLTIKRFVRGKGKLRKLGVVSSKQASQRVTIAVKGKLARKLRNGGRFRVVAVASDPARNNSTPRKKTFRVR